ncbi:glucan endo-1,3-beta-glucosidase 12 [Cocos nucifera]|uniref:Glucan endo-1,3-beta-glucosidase 12 n=1 Tax=Cocos nucifera TaxID=13894 RepID=A0A8K0IUT2_COCNU|nr:glucan endo-1,3-beta-glucosidase 12 [Cocos nucifera]
MGVRAIQCLIFLLGLLFCSGEYYPLFHIVLAILVSDVFTSGKSSYATPLGNHPVWGLELPTSKRKLKNSKGTLAKESDDGLSSSPTSLLQTIITKNTHMLQKPLVPKIEKESIRMLLANTKLESSDTMPQMDVVTPITTVPVINPSNPTMTTPTYNPVPTTSGSTAPPMTPDTNPYSTPTTSFAPPMTPDTNPYSTPTTSSPSSSGQSWCVASQTASQTALQVALDYACGYGGADCSQIQPGGSCYNPDTVRDHASYAFNDYYQKNPIPTSCDFGGTAIVTNTDPSTSTCHYPSTR